MRFLRLGMAVYIIVIGIQENNLWFIILGVLFSLMPLFNIGCCGAAGCNTTYSTSKAKNTEDITYEEVK